MWSLQGLYARDLTGATPDKQLSDTTDGSVYEYAMQIGYSSEPYGANNYTYYGMGHGAERRTSLTMTLDDVDMSNLATGSSMTGQNFVVNQSCDILKPVGTNAGAKIGTCTVKHTFNSSGLLVDHTHDIDTDTYTGPTELSYRTAYGAMLPGSSTNFNRAQSGNNNPLSLLAGNAILESGKQESVYTLYNSDTSINPYRVRLTLPSGKPELNVGWTYASPPSTYLFDRSAYVKWYIDWIKDSKVPAMDSIHQQKYDVIYTP
jgi:hypothetical protein